MDQPTLQLNGVNNSNSNAIIIIDQERALRDARARSNVVTLMQKESILREGIDFGIIPGSKKPSLLKPGAERLCAAFGFNPVFETVNAVERWDDDNGLFHYEVQCSLVHIDSGRIVATGRGSCNSKESKYRWRWVREEEVSSRLDRGTLLTRSSARSEFTFAVEKSQTTGQYGKPAEYWQAFKDAIADGSARAIKRKDSKDVERDAWEIGAVEYRIPNDDVFSLVNTILKMACKRALVAATLIGANASEWFTQDIEDLHEFAGASYTPPPTSASSTVKDDVVEGEIIEVTEQAPAPPPFARHDDGKPGKPYAPPPSARDVRPPLDPPTFVVATAVETKQNTDDTAPYLRFICTNPNAFVIARSRDLLKPHVSEVIYEDMGKVGVTNTLPYHLKVWYSAELPGLSNVAYKVEKFVPEKK